VVKSANAEETKTHVIQTGVNMYVTGEQVLPGDVVRGADGEGEIIRLVPTGPVHFSEDATVQWTHPKRALSTVPTSTLTLIRRKSQSSAATGSA
jgi:hypothetical protein